MKQFIFITVISVLLQVQAASLFSQTNEVSFGILPIHEEKASLSGGVEFGESGNLVGVIFNQFDLGKDGASSHITYFKKDLHGFSVKEDPIICCSWDIKIRAGIQLMFTDKKMKDVNMSIGPMIELASSTSNKGLEFSLSLYWGKGGLIIGDNSNAVSLKFSTSVKFTDNVFIYAGGCFSRVYGEANSFSPNLGLRINMF